MKITLTSLFFNFQIYPSLGPCPFLFIYRNLTPHHQSTERGISDFSEIQTLNHVKVISNFWIGAKASFFAKLDNFIIIFF